VASEYGSTDVVELLLAVPGIDVNLADNEGQTPLYWASRRGHSEVVELLLRAPGIDVNRPNQDGETPLYRASYGVHAEVVVLLAAAGEEEPPPLPQRSPIRPASAPGPAAARSTGGAPSERSRSVSADGKVTRTPA